MYRRNGHLLSQVREHRPSKKLLTLARERKVSTWVGVTGGGKGKADRRGNTNTKSPENTPSGTTDLKLLSHTYVDRKGTRGQEEVPQGLLTSATEKLKEKKIL